MNRSEIIILDFLIRYSHIKTALKLTCVFIVFPLALSDSRSPEEKANIVDEFFKRYENEVAKRPEDHGMDYVHAYIVIAKN